MFQRKIQILFSKKVLGFFFSPLSAYPSPPLWTPSSPRRADPSRSRTRPPCQQGGCAWKTEESVWIFLLAYMGKHGGKAVSIEFFPHFLYSAQCTKPWELGFSSSSSVFGGRIYCIPHCSEILDPVGMREREAIAFYKTSPGLHGPSSSTKIEVYFVSPWANILCFRFPRINIGLSLQLQFVVSYSAFIHFTGEKLPSNFVSRSHHIPIALF